jgi:4-carboxymuconolactone decarboxylase
MKMLKELAGAQKLIGDFDPKLVELTDDVSFGDVWERKELSPHDRSLITVASLITGGIMEQLRRALYKGVSLYHLKKECTEAWNM